MISLLTSDQEEGVEGAAAPVDAAAEVPPTSEVLPLTDTTNKNATDAAKTEKPAQARAPRERRERGPPADGIASKTKVMVANLPYDLTEEKVSHPSVATCIASG